MTNKRFIYFLVFSTIIVTSLIVGLSLIFKKSDSVWISLISNIVLVIVTTTYVFLTFQMLAVSKKQVSLAYRPIIYFKPSIGPDYNDPNPIYVGFNITNFGNSVALDCSFDINIYFSGNKVPKNIIQISNYDLYNIIPNDNNSNLNISLLINEASQFIEKGMNSDSNFISIQGTYTDILNMQYIFKEQIYFLIKQEQVTVCAQDNRGNPIVQYKNIISISQDSSKRIDYSFKEVE